MRALTALEKKQKNGTVSYYSVDLFGVFIITSVKKKSGVKSLYLKYLAPSLTLYRRH